MKFILNVIYLLILMKSCVFALNILAIFPYEGKSHFFVFNVYLRELAQRGHNLTVISHYPQKEPLHNYHDISLAGSSDIVVEGCLPAEKSYTMTLKVALYLATVGMNNCEVMLANKKVQKIVDDVQKFDVVVIEQFTTDCGLGLAYKLNAPVVAVTSHILMPFHHQRLGMPTNPAYVPFHFFEGGTKPTFYQRLERTVFASLFNSIFYVVQKFNERSLAKYYTDIPPLEELSRQIKFVLLYTNFVVTQPTLLPTNVIEVGGYHVGKAKELTGELKRFVDEAKHGIVYFSFGSVIISTGLSNEKVDIIVSVMKEFPQRFVWKWDNATVAIKNKLFIDKWLPQVDILGHNKTLAFISHGGMGSTTEAIYHGVPLLAMPLFGDQPCNAALIEESKLGIYFSINNLSKENLAAALRKVLDPRFRENVKRVSAAWHDRPMHPLDTAIYWTEYAARHPNITFRSASADVPFYQYMHLDVILFFILVFGIMRYSSKLLLSKRSSKLTENITKKEKQPKIKKSKKE